jgi:hypothetical protein
MTPDPKLNYVGAPVVTIGGKEFFVPTLALRQTRVAVPGLLKLMPKLNAVQSRIAEGDPLGAALLEQKDIELMIDVVCAGLSRAYPSITRDDLLDFEASFGELAAAAGVIARQTGLFKQPKTGEAQGEAQGEPAPQISTGSSLDTANIPESPGPTPSNPN